MLSREARGTHQSVDNTERFLPSGVCDDLSTSTTGDGAGGQKTRWTEPHGTTRTQGSRAAHSMGIEWRRRCQPSERAQRNG